MVSHGVAHTVREKMLDVLEAVALKVVVGCYRVHGAAWRVRRAVDRKKRGIKLRTPGPSIGMRG